MNGPGGDLFAIVYDGRTKSIHGLERQRPRAGGRDPGRIQEARAHSGSRSAARFRSTSVPGVVDGWNELLAKHGTRTLAQALEPAIAYARDGYAVCEIIAGQWKEVEALLARDPKTAATFLPGGKAPSPGDVFRNPALAASLEQIARGGRDVFYKGAIATRDRRGHASGAAD